YSFSPDFETALGHPQSNANGLETSTPLDESLVEQVSRLKLESSVSSDGESVNGKFKRFLINFLP
ncbi:hypothetical protein, partial [Planktothrix agardhii]|uniref:hypothetical protein n=1 Tax=Planktothrix agardhii TaxID=1160 RepID=UPI001F26936E